MDILITNGTLVTRDEAAPFIENGAVAIKGSEIAEVGDAKTLAAKYAGAEIVDAKGRLVMPGFINTHMHYYSTFARGVNFGGRPATTFGEVLRGLWWKLDKLLTLDDVYYSAVGPMIDEVRMGVTSAIDHHASPMAVRGSLFKIAEAAAHIGIRSNLCYEISDRDGESVADEGIAESVDFLKHCAGAGDDMLKGLFGMHAQMTVSARTLDKVVSAAGASGAGFHIHAAEGIEDVVNALSKYDMRVVERLFRHGVLNRDSIAVHCVHVTDEEIGMLAESGVAVVHNPESNMSNAVGTSPVLKMLEAGVLVGMGTDGYTSDMTASLRATHALHKHAAGVPSVAWGEPHAMLFENNREIMNRFLEGSVGTLKKGYLADIIVVDYDAPTPVTEDTISSHILFGISGRSVDTTIINGKIIMKNRELLCVDEERLVAESRAHAKALWNRI
ncbi:MAG: putative aminohydrolase SsnA [Clostridiales Family XIII bacterium]|jgi:putative selenium metabolism protein SsnA|nr:putative aminohydrolase SsnA [Clostridiales Family XIII bacterium]